MDKDCEILESKTYILIALEKPEEQHEHFIMC
jgi:hypothetical protein